MSKKITPRGYIAKVKHYRTSIIEHSASLEVQLEWIISSYFCRNSKEYWLFNYIFFPPDVEIGFYNKITMFDKLIKNVFPDVEKEHPDIIKKLNRIRKLRNDFAHGEATMFLSTEYIIKSGKGIIFMIPEKGIHKEVSYQFDYVDEILKDCMKLNGVLSKLIGSLKGAHNISYSKVMKELKK